MNQSSIGVPATMGRRVTARAIDVGVSMVLVVLFQVMAKSSWTQLHQPGYTLRGGTNEILRGIVARGLGLR